MMRYGLPPERVDISGYDMEKEPPLGDNIENSKDDQSTDRIAKNEFDGLFLVTEPDPDESSQRAC